MIVNKKFDHLNQISLIFIFVNVTPKFVCSTLISFKFHKFQFCNLKLIAKDKKCHTAVTYIGEVSNGCPRQRICG
jgi:hypothetical protein